MLAVAKAGDDGLVNPHKKPSGKSGDSVFPS